MTPASMTKLMIAVTRTLHPHNSHPHSYPSMSTSQPVHSVQRISVNRNPQRPAKFIRPRCLRTVLSCMAAPHIFPGGRIHGYNPVGISVYLFLTSLSLHGERTPSLFPESASRSIRFITLFSQHPLYPGSPTWGLDPGQPLSHFTFVL